MPQRRLRTRAQTCVAAALVVALGLVAVAPAAGSAPSPPQPPAPARAAAPSDEHAGHEGHDVGDGDDPDHASSHEDSAGLKLIAAPEDTPPPPGSQCRSGAPERRYDIAAIAVDITLNRFGDHDPLGRMYVLESELDRVRAEEAQNESARHTGAGAADFAVTPGLQGDAIAPLVLRMRPGECLRITLRNALDPAEPANLHLHGGSLQVSGGGGPAIATNPKAVAAPGATVSYEWQAPDDEPEATHYFHSEGDQRVQADHGLFGALVVEPRDAQWTDPRTGAEAKGWDAIVSAPGIASFREFVVMYREVGDESYQPLDRNGEFVPLVDPISESYRPDGRALSYRSEPFYNRFVLGQQVTGRTDESVAYSSYAYGDPATPLMRTYLGDPTKQRIVHAGSEVFHVHHVHGGATRWRRQPGEEDPGVTDQLVKKPELTPKLTERTDSQSLGPSETFDVVDECGAGGCQQSAGDFLYHCHIAHHYFAGMWGLWRVYNTLQDEGAATDALPPLAPLSDRATKTKAGVPASALVGTTVDSYGTTTTIGASDVAGW